MRHLVLLLLAIAILPLPLSALTYHVDFDAGDDTRSGQAPDQAWKHAPGDPQASGNAANVELKPGDVVQFRAGVVYRGEIKPPADGAEGQRVVYRGTGWGEGRAIVDGSDLITGFQPCKTPADAYGNPKFKNLYYADVIIDSPFLANLHELNPTSGRDEFLWTAQTPNPADPFFFDRRDSFFKLKRENFTTTSITDPEAFNQQDPEHWKDASVLIWVQPNFTRRYKVTSFDPGQNRIHFDDIGASALYRDGRDQAFAIYNSPHAIDQPGEYFLSEPRAGGKRRLLLWPRSADDLDRRISRSVRQIGFELTGRNHVEIDGFVVRKFSGAARTGGCGIVGDKSTGLLIRNNHVTHNMSGERGYGGIHLAGSKNSLIENNLVTWNKAHRAIFCSGVENVIVRNNTIAYPGTTALPVYRGKNVRVLNNHISHVYGTHANGITLYIACENVLVAGNVVTDSTTPITFQDSGPLYFFNNVTDGGGQYKNVNEWPNTRRGPWASGPIVFINNTFVNAQKNGALSLGKDADKPYVVINNILDGLAIDTGKKSRSVHSHNLYTGLANGQSAKYGWEMGPKEIVNENLAALIVNPNKLDYRLKNTGPAVGAGTAVETYLPTDAFPGFEFNVGKNIGATLPAQVGAKGFED